MAVSKVILNGVTLMDVTGDTVAADNLLTGYTATGADGLPITGTYVGGGGSSWTLLKTEEITVNTTSTSTTTVKTISVDGGWMSSGFLYIAIRPTTNKTDATSFISSDTFIFNTALMKGTTSISSTYNFPVTVVYRNANELAIRSYRDSYNSYGVFPYSITQVSDEGYESWAYIQISARYQTLSNNGAGAVSGTYNVFIYKLDFAAESENPVNYMATDTDITFTIDGVTYTAKSGDTWYGFICSDANTIGLYSSSGYPSTYNANDGYKGIQDADSNWVYSSAHITANGVYLLVGY